MAVEEGEEEGPQAAFAYAQSGMRYAFFVRRKGHFFEMTRDDDWVPTMVPARPRAAWATCVMARDALLGVLRRDAEKVLAGMVELFGLRLFCYGFFEALALPGGGGGGAVAGGARSPPSRRVSDDPPSQMQARQGQRPPRGRRGGGCGGARASASGALGSSALSGHTSPYAGSSSGGLPYRRPPGHSAGASATTTTTAAAAAAIGRAPSTAFLSPQARHYSAFPACDMAAMSVSLPNSPFGFALDGGQQLAQAGGGSGGGGGMAHEALFPSLGDDGLGIGGGMHAAAAGQRFGVAATPPMGYAGGGGGALDASALFSGVVAAAAAAGGGSPAAAFWDLAAHPHHHAHSHLHSPAMALGFGSPPSMAGLAGSMTEMSVAAVAAAASIALYPPPHPTPTMLGWDDMALSAGVLGGGGGGAHRHHNHNLHSSDMLMQLAQPSPTLSHYNLSAQATPAFEAYSTPVLGHLQHAAVPSPYIPSLSGAGSAAMIQPDHQPFLMHAAEGEGPSAMAAYFGVAPPPPSLPSLPPPPPLNHNHHRATNSVAGSQETLASSADALLAKGYMYAAAVSSGSTPAHQMDVEFSSH
ncbi:hypothetical protein GGI00_004904 [Coemansia sp. RSA 2681]|nr:hypothetical protein GGI00_004904 [Coemansia sp. RSA 2681]